MILELDTPQTTEMKIVFATLCARRNYGFDNLNPDYAKSMISAIIKGKTRMDFTNYVNLVFAEFLADADPDDLMEEAKSYNDAFENKSIPEVISGSIFLKSYLGPIFEDLGYTIPVLSA